MNIESDVKIYEPGMWKENGKRANRVDMMDLGETRRAASLEFQGARNYMEDRVLIIPEFYNNASLAAVFDGHGGSVVADFLKTNTEKVFFEKMWRNEAEPKISLGQTVSELNRQIAENTEMKYAGAAALWAIIENNKLILANVGDCEAVLIRDGKAVVLTEKHNLRSEAELNKIKKSGGIISEEGNLVVNTDRGKIDFALTRTIGDKDIAETFISAEPFMAEINLEEGDSDLILASDGLWGVVDYQVAAELVQMSSDSIEAVSNLKQLAIENKSMDNISVVVVKLK